MTNTLTNIEFDAIDDKYVKSIIGNGIYDDVYLCHPDYSDDQHCAIVNTIKNLGIDTFSTKWAEKYVGEYQKRVMVADSTVDSDVNTAIKLIKQVNELFANDKINSVTIVNDYIETSKKVIDYYNLLENNPLYKVVSYGTNREIMYYCNKIDHLKNGLCVQYYSNGNIKSISMYNNGKMHGMHIEFNDSGNLKSVRYYKNDNPFGILKSYWIDGDIQLITLYYHKKIKIEYHINGTMAYKFQYLINTINFDGNQISWHNNGQIKGTNSFINGKKEEVERWYYENGNMKSICSYKNDGKVGIEIMYHKDGSINSVKKYDETGCVQSLRL